MEEMGGGKWRGGGRKWKGGRMRGREDRGREGEREGGRVKQLNVTNSPPHGSLNVSPFCLHS